MSDFDRRIVCLAAGLAALAGYVDALGFIELGGFFTAFMSGNSTRMAVGLTTNLHHALIAAGLILGFVAGVVLGSLAGHYAGNARGAVIMLIVGLLLTAGAALYHSGETAFAVGAVVLAMGAENAVFEREGKVAVGLTYMTGTLVTLGLRFAAALRGERGSFWVRYAVMWLGLICGAAGGAFAHSRIGLEALWFAAGAALVLAAGLFAVRTEEE